MKKCLILTIAIISVLMLTMDIHAGFGGSGASMGQGGQARGRGMGQMGGFGGMRGGMLNVEAVNAAIAVIEEQVAALKGAMEGAGPMTFGRGDARGGAEGGEQVNFQAMMAQMQERQAAVQAAADSISEQLIILDSTPIQTEITELQAALTQANEEEATETAALIQAMIIARREKAQRLGINVGGRGRGGNRGGAGGRGGMRGGFGGGGNDATTASYLLQEWGI